MGNSSVCDALVADAARITGAPVAFLGVMDESGERLVAAVGTRAGHVGNEISFARCLNGAAGPVIVNDTSGDSRFAAHPLVTGVAGIRFYAGVPIRNESGEVIAALSVCDRVPRELSAEQTEMLRLLARHAERELLMDQSLTEAQDRFREFFEHTSDLVMTIAPDGTLLHANETAESALGISRGSRVESLVDREHREEFLAALDAVFDRAETVRIETVFINAGGVRMTVEGSLRPKVVGERMVMLARVVFRDVSDRKVFESELANARDAALEAARLKSQFLTNVSHEIRTPMNGITGMIDLLVASQLGAEQLDFAHQARASAEQLLSIVNNILHVSALEAGSLSSPQVDFDLFRTMERIVEVMKIAALGSDLDVRLVYDKTLPAVFRGEQSKLRIILSNLMENAVKFTESGTVELSVTQQTETETHRVLRFAVRDTGIGISDEHRLLLFERFSQVEASSARRFQGVGLGLAAARRLVEMMGGVMDVDSAPGKGSTFWFTIPLPKETRNRRPIPSSDLDLGGKRVLLVGGPPNSRRVTLHYMQVTWEMRVDVCEEAEALAMARAAATTDPYRVIVHDALGGGDPLSFARAVRADSAIGGTSIIRLVNASERADQEAMRSAGITAFVMKPIGQTELYDALTLALAHDAIPVPRRPLSSESRAAAPVVGPDQRRAVRVLLAEDNFLNMKLTMSQLQKLGYTADSVANGREALAATREREYDIVLMDCQMPVMDGYEATLEIRRREREGGRRLRVIAMTANALEGDREKCLSAGMDDYLAKPTRQEDLEAALALHFAAQHLA